MHLNCLLNLQLAALEAVIEHYGDYEKAASEPDGRKAMLAHIHIPLIGVKNNEKQYDMAIALMGSITEMKFAEQKTVDQKREYFKKVCSKQRVVLKKFRFKCRIVNPKLERLVSDVLENT